MTLFKRPLLALLLILPLTACGSPIEYKPGHTAAELPASTDVIVLDTVTEGTIHGDEGKSSMTSANDADMAHVNDLIRATIKDIFAKNNITLTDSTGQTAGSYVLRGKSYYLPYNPVTGGHINVFVKLSDKNGTEIVTGFAGADFGMINLGLHGTDGVIQRMAEKAATRLAEELKKKR